MAWRFILTLITKQLTSAIINKFKAEYSENILPITALITDNTVINYSGDGLVTLSDDYHFSDNKSLKLDLPLSTTLSKISNLNIGSGLLTSVKYDGRYIFSFRFLDKTSKTSLANVTLGFNVFINSVLTFTFDKVIDLDVHEEDKFYTIAQSFDLNADDIVDFSFFVSSDSITPSQNVYLYFSGFKLELDDRFLGIPSIYSKPIATQVGNYKIISFLSDLPEAVSNVITLEDNVTYFIANTIDLLGDRLVGGANTTIIGGSSENSILTSTGLGVGVPLLSSIYTTPIRHISFNDVDTAISFDGSTNPNEMALDWTGVNFVNVPNVGLVKDASNFIFDKGAFLNSKGLSFDGTIGTIGFGNSLFRGDGLAGDLLRIESTCTITRRFRIIYSSVIAFGSTTGLNVNVSATIPVEGYILDTINFSGGGTYLSGVAVTDNKSLFVNCKGIENSEEISQYYMNGNATATTIVSVGVSVKVAGTTTSSSVTQKFTNTDNRATYIGSLTRFFKVTATLSLESGNNNQVGVYIAKNGTLINESEVYGTTSGSGRAENIVVQTLVQLSENDYIEIFVENDSATNNITVTDLNVILI